MDRSNFASELCQDRNNTVALPGFPCLNPIPRLFDTETDSDPDPDLASPLTFSDNLEGVRGRPERGAPSSVVSMHWLAISQIIV
ncbi:MAG: hypothetical protein PHF14_07050 [Verrucomicrobiota bacterium]|nr:hypothetical protein [Verrucomicrobiota bacterium]